VTALRHTWQVALRYIRALLRQPAWVGISLVQPVIWLLLFGGLFRRTADIPGFTGGSYIEFLTPGVVVMLAVSAAGWVGMGFIEDINRGTMDRLLVSPIWRGALNLGSVAQSVLSIVIQSVIVIGLSLAVGAHFHNGVAGVAVLVAVAGLLGAVFASLSNGVAVLTRQRETLIGIVTMVTLPLTFLSSALMQQSLLPTWIRQVQSCQLGGRSRAVGGRKKRRLGPDRDPHRLPRAAPARQRRLRHPRLQRVPEIRLTAKEKPP
jgi:ABC-2 type transport system permease protein